MNQKSQKLLLLLSALTARTATAEEVVGEVGATKTVRVSKEDVASFKSASFIKNRDLSDVLVDKIKLLATTVTERQGGSNQRLVEISNGTKELSHDRYWTRLSVMHYQQEDGKNADMDAVRVHLLGQTRKSTEVKFKEAFPIVETIRKGISFRYSPNKSSSSASRSEGSPSNPNIRYGLVAQDILPASSAVQFASLGSMSDMGYEYAKPAKVVYTIDKLEESTSGKKVYRETRIETDHVEISSETGLPAPTAEEIFKRPSTDLDIKLEAANSEDSVSDKVGNGALPGAKVTVMQADGLIGTQVITNSRLGKESMNHIAKLPLYGEAHISRKFDEKFKPTETAAMNLLGKASAPKLNIIRNESESKFKAELLVKRPQLEWGVAVEPHAQWTPDQRILSEKGDKVSLTFSNSF
jgi:hypothetical protein